MLNNLDAFGRLGERVEKQIWTKLWYRVDTVTDRGTGNLCITPRFTYAPSGPPLVRQ